MTAKPPSCRENPVYAQVLRHIDDIYGDKNQRHPIAAANMTLSLSAQKLVAEATVKSIDRGLFGRRLLLAKLLLENLIGRLLIRLKIRTAETDWGQYVDIVRQASDCEKFDGMLRMVIAGTAQQRIRLMERLNALEAAGQLIYGIHPSNRALLTCLVFQRSGRQVHFVDAADGGYALAARQIKTKLDKS